MAMPANSNVDIIHSLSQTKSSAIPISDLEEESNDNFQTSSTLQLENALHSVGDVLTQASKILNDLENDDHGIPRLGEAIRRYAADLANLVGNVAQDLEIREHENNVSWAKAIIQDAELHLALQKEQPQQHQIQQKHVDTCAAITIINTSEEDIENAITSARFILLDIQEALNSISKDDAEEIADATLVVAKLFIWSLQSIQSQVSHSITCMAQQSQGNNGFEVYEIHDTSSYDSQHYQHDENNDNNENKSTTTSRTATSVQSEDRIRLIWPPIGPAVSSLLSSGKNEVLKHPILSIAISMALWPTAFILAVIGIPICAFDIVLQSGYNVLEDQPLLINMEKGAANLVQIGKLYFLISKLFLKQSIRVGKRQIQRQGGIQQIVEGIGHWTSDRIKNPIESVGMLCNTIKTGAGIALEAALFVKDTIATATNGGNTSNHDYNYNLSV